MRRCCTGARRIPDESRQSIFEDGTELEIWGYCYSFTHTAITTIGYIVTVFLLRLVLHWMPEWLLYSTHRQCSIEEAEKVLIKDQYGRYTVHSVKITTSRGTRVKLVKDNKNAVKRIFENVDMHAETTRNLLTPTDETLVRCFFYKKLKYVWNDENRSFELLRGLDSDWTNSYLKAEPLNMSSALNRRVLFGENRIDVPITPLMSLLVKEALNPFYIFQAFSCALWYSDEYYYYASCIIFISVFSLSWELYEMRKAQKALRDTVCSTGTALVARGNTDYYQELDAADLVPGDVIEIPKNGCTMMSDVILLSGHCIVNESMLTGESVPITKVPLTAGDSNEVFSIKTHSRNVLFCGTQVIQTRYYEGERVRAVVIRTGFRTAKGELVRSIMFPKPIEFKFQQDAMKYIGFLALIAMIGFAFSLYMKIQDGSSLKNIIVRSLDLVTIIVPPALPVAMTVGIVFAQRRLKKNRIFCISPNTINVCGVINVVCFDKTGTLTEDGLDLLCVVPCTDRQFSKPASDPYRLPKGQLLEAMATCHSLTRIEGELAGDPLDVKMFQAIRWEFIEEISEDHRKFEMAVPVIVRPTELSGGVQLTQYDPVNQEEMPYEIGIIRQFTFSSSLQRMSVIAKVLQTKHFHLYVKGSPEMISSLSKPQTIPEDFQETLHYYTRRGYRVLALAWRPLNISYVKALRVKREIVERDLNFLGLLVMENRLKPQTEPVIRTLKNANIRLVMITGDNMLTALSVARDCSLVEPNDSIVFVTATPPPVGGLGEAMVEFHTSEDFNQSVTADTNGVTTTIGRAKGDQNVTIQMMEERSDFHFALTGKTWSIIREYSPDLICKLVVKGIVFARFSPDQKVQVVEALQTIGYYVGMCGDGANDCGALKAAHTGVSLSEAEASVASPFTSKEQNISCVPDLIREGRCALTTSFGTFKFMAGYSMCQFTSVLILYWVGTNLSDFQFLYIDLAVITTLGVTFGYTKAYKRLSVHPPGMRLVSLIPIVSLFFQVFLNIAFQAGAYFFLIGQSWYTRRPADAEEDVYGCYENSAIFIISCFQYISLALVFSKGAPYRRSVFSNYGFIINVLLLVAVSLYICIKPFAGLKDLMEFVDFPNIYFRVILIGVALSNFIIAFLAEAVINAVAFKKCALRLKQFLCPRMVQHRKHEIVRDEITHSTPPWPPVRKIASVQEFCDKIAYDGPISDMNTILKASCEDPNLVGAMDDPTKDYCCYSDKIQSTSDVVIDGDSKAAKVSSLETRL